MNRTKRSFNGLAATAFFVGSIALSTLAAFATATDYEIANGLDPVTLGQAPGSYTGGTLLPGEYFPTLAAFAAATTDEEITNGLDPITTGQVIGDFPGGKVLPGEYLPGEGFVLTAERKR